MTPRSPEGGNALYITYDGLTDPLGRSQVLPYLVGLARRGHRITVLSCEKPGRTGIANTVQQICDQAGIIWRHIPYLRRPPVVAHAFTLANLIRTARRLATETPFDVVHCRSYVPALAGLSLKHKFGTRVLFDMRGFWPDEKVEGGSWPQSKPVYRGVYRYLKRAEKRLLREADHIISLTETGKNVMAQWPAVREGNAAITVIPCCVDFDHFPLPEQGSRDAARRALGISDDARVLAYLGSLGTWYMRDEMLDFFRVYLARHPQAVFLFVTPDEPESIRAAARERGIDPQRLVIRSATREEVPQLMSAADLGIFFIRTVSSKAASSPTKMGEMLALGLPTIANGGVGDVAAILEATGAGVAIEKFDDTSYESAIDAVEGITLTPALIRQKALPWFDVERGIDRYDEIYRTFGSRP